MVSWLGLGQLNVPKESKTQTAHPSDKQLCPSRYWLPFTGVRQIWLIIINSITDWALQLINNFRTCSRAGFLCSVLPVPILCIQTQRFGMEQDKHFSFCCGIVIPFNSASGLAAFSLYLNSLGLKSLQYLWVMFYINTFYIFEGVKQHSWRRNFMYYSPFLAFYRF